MDAFFFTQNPQKSLNLLDEKFASLCDSYKSFFFTQNAQNTQKPIGLKLCVASRFIQFTVFCVQ